MARTSAAASILSRTRYEPFGATAAGSNLPGIGFTGHVNDPDTGLVYMQQRYYEPYAARFLSVDPVTTDANSGRSFNRYVYAANNPFKYVDPDCRDISDLSECQRSAGCWGGGSTGGRSGGSVLDRPASIDPAEACGKGPTAECQRQMEAWRERYQFRERLQALDHLGSEAFQLLSLLPPSRVGMSLGSAATGLATGGKFHSQKGTEYVRALENWQARSSSATHYDRMVAESLKNDLLNALGK